MTHLDQLLQPGCLLLGQSVAFLGQDSAGGGACSTGLLFAAGIGRARSSALRRSPHAPGRRRRHGRHAGGCSVLAGKPVAGGAIREEASVGRAAFAGRHVCAERQQAATNAAAVGLAGRVAARFGAGCRAVARQAHGRQAVGALEKASPRTGPPGGSSVRGSAAEALAQCEAAPSPALRRGQAAVQPR